MKKLLLILAATSIKLAFAASINSESSSLMQGFSESDIKALKKVAEKEKLAEYSGDLGTAPKNKTVSSTGAALEETPSGPQVFLFWTQTLANGFYYEGRLYGKYNAQTQNPEFPDVAPSQENNPDGYKGVFKLGYAFHLTPVYDITPYLRLEAGKDMSLVYADSNGNYIHSTNYAILPGFKQSFKLSDNFAPYIDIYGGLNQVSLTGDLYDNGKAGGWSTNSPQNATVQQYQVTTELGAALKISEHQAIIPYIQFQYNSNSPDAVATAKANSTGNGFGIGSLTTSQQVYAIKYSYSY